MKNNLISWAPTIMLITMLLVVFGGIIFVIETLSQEYHKEKKRIEVSVGEKIVLGKDTLSIVNYSFFERTYILDNGKKVDVEFAKKNLVKKVENK